jgi:mono/diheme cytochrome c family protein
MYIEVTPQALGGLDPEGLARIDAVQNPVVADARSRARGEVMYERNCTICHGADAAGPTDAFLGVWPLLAAYPLTAPVTLDRTDGYLYGMISVGRGAMPAYGQRIPFWDRWDVVNYLRTLQGIAPNSGAQGSPDPDPAPAAEAAGGGEES